jgi:hypothetical protein
MANIEDLILFYLNRQVDTICKTRPIPGGLRDSVYVVCSSFTFPKIFGEYHPEEIAIILFSMLKRNIIKEVYRHESTGDLLPCFIPASVEFTD